MNSTFPGSPHAVRGPAAGPGPAFRRRDAAATRSELLSAAILRFTEQGYDRTSVRDIARDAGVDSSLIYRYFGSKQALFERASALGTTLHALLDAPLDDVPDLLCDFVLDDPHSGEAVHPMLTMLRSLGHDDVRRRLHDQLTDTFSGSLAARLRGPHAQVRAELLGAWLMGIGVLRNVVGTPALATAPPEAVRRCVRAGAAALLNTPADEPGDGAGRPHG